MIRVLFDNTSENIPQEKKIKWLDLLAPTHTELKNTRKQYNLNVEFLTAALDPNERARHEIENDKMLIVIRFPVETDPEQVNENNEQDNFYELPYITEYILCP